jgi:D-glycero-D-manno-heptose 1,7-bisphosphate phosphatase
MLKPAVFLDRDGVLVRPVVRDGFPYAPLRREEFALLAGGAEAVAALRAAGFVVVVITNQPEVRRGALDPALLEEFHRRLREAVPVHDVVACCHDDRDGCACRKPRPGMILEAARRHGLDLGRSYLVGDTERDLGAARAAGLPFLLLEAPYNRHLEAWRRAPDIGAAARVILELSAPR